MEISREDRPGPDALDEHIERYRTIDQDLRGLSRLPEGDLAREIASARKRKAVCKIASALFETPSVEDQHCQGTSALAEENK